MSCALFDLGQIETKMIDQLLEFRQCCTQVKLIVIGIERFMKVIRTEKFIENTISVRWFTDLDRKTITTWNLLCALLSARTEKFNTRQAKAAADAHAYGARIGYGIMGYGEKLMIECRMSFIRSDLVQDAGYEQEVLTLLDQALNHPLLTEQFLQEAKYLLKNRLIYLDQDPDSRALREALKIAGKGNHLSISMQGYLEDLDAIELADIQSCYEMLKSLPSQTLMVGKFGEAITQMLETQFPGKPLSAKWQALVSVPFEEITLEREISQSSLVQIYETGILPQHEDYFALLVLNGLLGASSVSLLFETIREKHSYCYSIQTNLIRFDGALVISTGTDRKHLADVKRLIQEVIADVIAQNYDANTLESVKMEICDGMAGQKDSPTSMMEQQFLNEILNREISVDQIMDNIRSVNPEDLVRVASRLKLAASAQLVQKEGE